jgi:hypothetical protein
VDIFDPEVVVWAYEAAPQDAVRALLDLVHPAHPVAPTLDYPAPARSPANPANAAGDPAPRLHVFLHPD